MAKYTVKQYNATTGETKLVEEEFVPVSCPPPPRVPTVEKLLALLIAKGIIAQAEADAFCYRDMAKLE